MELSEDYLLTNCQRPDSQLVEIAPTATATGKKRTAAMTETPPNLSLRGTKRRSNLDFT